MRLIKLFSFILIITLIGYSVSMYKIYYIDSVKYPHKAIITKLEKKLYYPAGLFELEFIIVNDKTKKVHNSQIINFSCTEEIINSKIDVLELVPRNENYSPIFIIKEETNICSKIKH